MLQSIYIILLALSLLFGAGYYAKDRALELYYVVSGENTEVEVASSTSIEVTSVAQEHEERKYALETEQKKEKASAEEEFENRAPSTEENKVVVTKISTTSISDVQSRKSTSLSPTSIETNVATSAGGQEENRAEKNIESKMESKMRTPPLKETSQEFIEIQPENSTPTTEETLTQSENTTVGPTISGVLSETNKHRTSEGLNALSLNAQLSSAARVKALDMFARQYFAHNSPTNENAGDVVANTGYSFLMVGENLALGNYKNSEVLVDAWMNSSEHRENIMRAQYKEIGIAIERGIYQGQEVFIAVQIFARPQSACPAPHKTTLSQIEMLKKDIAAISK